MHGTTGLPVAAATAVLLALGATACGGSSNSSSAPATSESGTSTIKLPAMEMLTGDVAYYGQLFMNGIQVAVDQVNASGGVNGAKLDLVKLDNASTNAQTVTLLRQYCSDDNVGLLIAPTYQTNSDAGGPVSNSCGLPTITGVGDIDPGTNPRGYMFKNTTVRQPDQISNTLRWAIDQSHANKVAQITDVSVGPYVLYRNVGTKYLKSRGVAEVAQSTNGSQGSYGPQITALRAAKPDLVVVTLQPPDAAHFIEQARGQGLTSTFVATCGCLNDPTLFANSHGAADGFLSSSPWAPPEHAATLMPTFATFVTAYEKKYGKITNPEAVYTYDSVMLAVEAIKNAGSGTDREKIKKALSAMPKFCAAMCYSSDRHGSFVTTTLYFTKLTSGGFDVVSKQ
jgi:branched-chain amino acid transport system substrate-binding protein